MAVDKEKIKQARIAAYDNLLKWQAQHAEEGSDATAKALMEARIQSAEARRGDKYLNAEDMDYIHRELERIDRQHAPPLRKQPR